MCLVPFDLVNAASPLTQIVAHCPSFVREPLSIIINFYLVHYLQ